MTEAGKTDQEYDRCVKRRAYRKKKEYVKVTPHLTVT